MVGPIVPKPEEQWNEDDWRAFSEYCDQKAEEFDAELALFAQEV